jgi:coenzyme F420-reducing hydrogenase delta subunit
VTSTHPKESSFAPQIVVLYCQHCVSEDAAIAPQADPAADFSMEPVMMPCSSKIETSYVLKILERGADAVQIVACSSEGCRFLVGSLRAEKRIETIRGLLDEIHVGAERVGISRASRVQAQELMNIAAGRAQAVQELGPIGSR